MASGPGLLNMLPSASASTNPAMSAFSFGSPDPAGSYASTFLPLPPTTPNNVIRDPLMGSMISLSTVSDTQKVLTLPDVLVFSSANENNPALYTIVMPVIDTKDLTTFRFTVRDFPQVPINQVSELGVPRYLSNRKWTSTTSLTRWAIGNRYSMEYLNQQAGQQQQIADKMQIAVSFAGLLDNIVLDTLKNSHVPLRQKLMAHRNYTYDDVSEAMEWQKDNFAALQKKENGWQLFMQRAKKRMQMRRGNATALIVDKSISLLFPQRPELVQFYKSGMPAAPRVNNPERLMSENSPVDQILFTNFKPALVDTLLSPMEHVVQLGSWFISRDLPMHTSNRRYAELYTTQCREIQIYDQELDTFVTLKMRDMVKHSHMFEENGRFKREILEKPNDNNPPKSSFIGDVFSGAGNNGPIGENARASMNMMINSLMFKLSYMARTNVTEMESWLEDGLKAYEKMASQPFDRKHVTGLIRWAVLKGQATTDTAHKQPTSKYNPSKFKGNDNFTDPGTAQKLLDLPTSSLKMNVDENKKFGLPSFKDFDPSVPVIHPFHDGTNLLGIHKQPPSSFCGHLSWDGFSQIHAYYDTLTSNQKAEAESDWLVIYNFVEAIKKIVHYWKNNLTQCSLFDSIKNTDPAKQKSFEECLADQVFNFNATFTLWTNYHKLGLFFGGGGRPASDPDKFGGEALDALVAPTAAAAVDKWEVSEKGLANQEMLGAIYSKLVANTFGSLLESIREKAPNNIFFQSVRSMLKYNPGKGDAFLLGTPDLISDNKVTAKQYKLEAAVTLDSVKNFVSAKNLNPTIRSNIPTVAAVHWALVGEWVLRVYEIALYTIYAALESNVAETDIIAFIGEVKNIFEKREKSDTITAANELVEINKLLPINTAEWSKDSAYKFVEGLRLSYIASSKKAKPNVSEELQKLWFIPKGSVQDAIEDKKQALMSASTKLLKGTDVSDVSHYGQHFDFKAPNHKTILTGDIPLLRFANVSQTFTQPFDETALVDDFKDTFKAGGLTMKLANELGLTTNDQDLGHTNDPVFYGAYKKTDSMLRDQSYDEIDNTFSPKTKLPFSDLADIWVRTPFKLSYEQVLNLYGEIGVSKSELDFRVSNPSTELEVIVHPNMPKNKKPFTVNGKELSYMTYSQLETLGSNTKNDLFIVSGTLPFVESRFKCRILVDGVPLSTSINEEGPRKHVGDNLFGYRLNAETETVAKIHRNLMIFSKHNRSPFYAAVSLLLFSTTFNRTNSEAFIEQDIPYPYDFIIWRLWSNYVCNLGFLVNPGRENLGFVAIACADHRSGQTPMTKEGMFNSSVWAGGVLLKPENTMTLHGLAVTSFGHGGGTGYLTVEQAKDERFRSNYRRPDAGVSSPSLLVSAIPKGSCPNRMVISVTGKLPEGDYNSSGLQLSPKEKSETIDHYETWHYYSRLWELYGNSHAAEELGRSLSADGGTLKKNVIAYRGTTKYFNPFTNAYDLITLNTGHLGPDEGPGCRSARLNAGIFPTFDYLKTMGLAD